MEKESGKTFRITNNSVVSLWEGVEMLEFLLEKAGARFRAGYEPAGRSKGCAERFCSVDGNYVRHHKSGYRTASHFVCSQPGNPRITSEDVMESGRRCVCHLNQRNAKGRRSLFAHPADHRAGRKERECRNMVVSPRFLMKRIVCYTCQRRWIIAGEEAEKRRGGDGKSYPFPDLFHLCAYAGTVYFIH